MNHNNSHHFIPPLRFYVGTFIALLFLTFITVFVAQFDFGSMNIVVALLIACIKASLVLAFFMGLRWDNGVNLVVVVSSVVFIGIFFLFTIADIATRGDYDILEDGVHNINSPVKIISDGQIGGSHH
jgi:cytochrome c oxidase subunit IV